MKIDEIKKKIKIDWDKINLKEFKAGIREELEHKNVTKGNSIKTAKIVLAHLKEKPDYYTRLKKAMK